MSNNNADRKKIIVIFKIVTRFKFDISNSFIDDLGADSLDQVELVKVALEECSTLRFLIHQKKIAVGSVISISLKIYLLKINFNLRVDKNHSFNKIPIDMNQVVVT